MAHWNLDNLKEIALLYESKTEFAKAQPAAYRAAKRMIEKLGIEADRHIFWHITASVIQTKVDLSDCARNGKTLRLLYRFQR